jgi:dTDP-D-glucose 4,6-dehydratase
MAEFYEISKLHTFESGLAKTIEWYLRNEEWWVKQWGAREIEITLPDGRKVKH